MGMQKQTLVGMIGAAGMAGAFLVQGCMQPAAAKEKGGDKDLAQQIFETMSQVPGNQADHRPVHAKGIVCQGKFEPSAAAAGLSRAAHFRAAVPVTVRFSDGSPMPAIPDNSPDAGP